MIRLCSKSKCLYDDCNIKTNKRFCKDHSNFELRHIPYFLNIDPFILELRIINFQNYWRNKLLINKNLSIIRNIRNIVNEKDPLTMEVIIKNGVLQTDIDKIYPIQIDKFIYIYKLESLKEIICKYSGIEPVNKIKIYDNDIININKLCKSLKIKMQEYEYSINEIYYFKKVDALQKLDILGTYFPINLYENINSSNKLKIYNELRSIWYAFCIDNKINERKVYKKKIIWHQPSINNVDELLINKIDFLLNEKFDISFKKMISYLIIGAFSYIDSNVKKIYNNIDFI